MDLCSDMRRHRDAKGDGHASWRSCRGGWPRKLEMLRGLAVQVGDVAEVVVPNGRMKFDVLEITRV